MLGLDALDTADEQETIEVPKKRSFRSLWEVLANLTTGETLSLLVGGYNENDDGATSTDAANGASDDLAHAEPSNNGRRNAMEIGASRRAAIMNVMRRNIGRCLDELSEVGYFDDDTVGACEGGSDEWSGHRSGASDGSLLHRSRIERRLAALIDTFDTCSSPPPNFDRKLWRGLTIVLIAVVCPRASFNDDERGVLLPPSIVNLGILPEEYDYLTKSVFVSLG